MYFGEDVDGGCSGGYWEDDADFGEDVVGGCWRMFLVDVGEDVIGGC